LIERYNETALNIDTSELQSDDSNPQVSDKTIEELTLLFFDDDFLDNIDDLVRQVKLRKLQIDLSEINYHISNQPNNNELMERKLFIQREIRNLSKNIVKKTMY
jgi:hypothetical protein